MITWSVKLSEFHIVYESRMAIKSQYLADFMVEFTKQSESAECFGWTIYVDGSSNTKGSGAEVILEGPDGVSIEHALHFGFTASNNQAEYEALIAGLTLALEVGASSVKVCTDSQLVSSQVNGTYQARDDQMVRYLSKVQDLKQKFKDFQVVYVGREDNARA